MSRGSLLKLLGLIVAALGVAVAAGQWLLPGAGVRKPATAENTEPPPTAETNGKPQAPPPNQTVTATGGGQAIGTVNGDVSINDGK